MTTVGRAIANRNALVFPPPATRVNFHGVPLHSASKRELFALP